MRLLDIHIRWRRDQRFGGRCICRVPGLSLYQVSQALGKPCIVSFHASIAEYGIQRTRAFQHLYGHSHAHSQIARGSPNRAAATRRLRTADGITGLVAPDE